MGLVHFILPLMRRAISKKAPELYQGVCPRLLKHLLQQKLPHVFQAVASELVKPGKSPALQTMLNPFY